MKMYEFNLWEKQTLKEKIVKEFKTDEEASAFANGKWKDTNLLFTWAPLTGYKYNNKAPVRIPLSDEEKQITAYHEAGHAILNHFLPESDPNYKCTIIPRGRALGVTIKLPAIERHNYGKKFLLSEIVVLLGGRVAEEIMFGEQTTGAQNDFERSTSMARKMVTQWGMSELGPLSFGKRDEQVFLGKELAHQQDYSEDTAIEIDRAVRQIINECYDQARTVVETNLDGLKKLAESLLEHETLVLSQIEEILGPRPSLSS